MPRRLRHLVYVDAVVPKPGESWSSTHASATREARLAAAQASPDYSFPPPDPAVFGLAARTTTGSQRRQTPHPGHTYEAPLDFDPQRVAGVPRTFVSCTQPALAHHRCDPPARAPTRLLGRRLARRRRACAWSS